MGSLWPPGNQLDTGFFVTQAPSWIDSKISVAGNNLTQSSTTQLTRVRGGLGWRSVPDTALYADVQYLHIRNRDDSANFVRFMFMSEKFVTASVPIRFGMTLDTAGEATPTAAIGVYGLKGVNFDFYYSYNAYPEVRRELGKTNYWMLVVSRMF